MNSQEVDRASVKSWLQLQIKTCNLKHWWSRMHRGAVSDSQMGGIIMASAASLKFFLLGRIIQTSWNKRGGSIPHPPVVGFYAHATKLRTVRNKFCRRCIATPASSCKIQVLLQL
jgi:hypothetical protein